jgi:hypothetical protein
MNAQSMRRSYDYRKSPCLLFTIQKTAETMCYFILCVCDWQNTWHNNLKGGKISFSAWFQRLQCKGSWLCVSGPVEKQNIMKEWHGRRNLLASWQPESREKKGQGKRYIFPRHTSKWPTSYEALPPIFYHLPKMPFILWIQ